MLKSSWSDVVTKSPPHVETKVDDLVRPKEGRGTIVLYRASTNVKDRDQQSISVKGDGKGKGWTWNEEKLPAHLFGHDSRNAENWIGRGSRVFTTDDALMYEAELFDESPSPVADIARQIAWIAEKHPRDLSSSVGFLPKKWTDKNGTGVYTMENPGPTRSWDAGLRFVEQELLEHSAVPVPSLIESVAVQVRSLIDKAGAEVLPSTLEELLAAAIERAAEMEDFLAKASALLPEDTSPAYAPSWKRLGLKHVISRPSQKAGAVLSRADLDRLTKANDAMTAFLASATPAEEHAA